MWTVVSGAKSTLSNPLYEKMTDNGDGTYSYTYTLTNDGAVTVIVKLSTGNGLYSEWFGNINWTAPTIKTNISSIVAYDVWYGLNWVNLPSVGYSYFSAYLYGTIIPPTTESYSFNYWWDDGPAYFLFNSETTYTSLWWTSFSMSLIANKPYDFRFKWSNTSGNAVLKLYWSTPTISYTLVPSSYFNLMRNVGSSPIQISVSCPTGYSSGQPSYTNICHEIWGDGLRVGSEKWDDGNTSNGDGCSSNCLTIESGYQCAGGSSTSKDICVNWGTGLYQNYPSNPTEWISICGDGIKAVTEACDDGNLISGDGWSADWSTIESGFICSGGTCSAWNELMMQMHQAVMCVVVIDWQSSQDMFDLEEV